MSANKKLIPTLIFLFIEAILYYFILTASGSLLIWSSFISIILCFLFSFLFIKSGDKFIITALLFTTFADYFLVVANPINRLTGMMFFMVAQTLYAVKLHKTNKNKALLISRVIIILIAEVITFFILGENVDLLSVVSIYYYANLIMNIVLSSSNFKNDKLFPIGLVLLFLCDTVIGLQTTSGAYLNIPENSLVYRIIFMDFFLSWFFYLPSQIIISLSSIPKKSSL